MSCPLPRTLPLSLLLACAGPGDDAPLEESSTDSPVNTVVELGTPLGNVEPFRPMRPATVLEICDNGVDDNGNGLVDCEDATCVSAAGCMEQACNDGLDDDNDGMADCDDDDCWDACNVLLTWVTTGEGAFRDPGVLQLAGELQGGAYRRVNYGTPELCDWSLSGPWYASFPPGPSATMDFWSTPGCGLMRSSVVPAVSTLSWPGSDTVRTTYGAAWLRGSTRFGAVIIPTSYGFSSFTNGWFSAGLVPGDPRGMCPGGVTSLRRYRDADGDGFGVSDLQDLRGAPGGTVYVCEEAPGTSRFGGDCDDQDPTWNPVDVRLAPGGDCSDAGRTDRDGDGIDDVDDPFPNNGSRP